MKLRDLVWMLIFPLATSATAQPTFAPPVFYPAGDMPMSVAVADLDGDHVPDLAVANQDPDGVTVLLGTGAGAAGVGSLLETSAQSRLARPAPDPVRSRTTICFEMPTAGRVSLRLHDVGGRLAFRRPSAKQ